jgi:hypothetical protein
MMSKNAKMACYLLVAVAVVIGVIYLGKHMQWWGEEHFYVISDSKEDKRRHLNNLLETVIDIADNKSKYETIKSIKYLINDILDERLNSLPQSLSDFTSDKSLDDNYKEFEEKDRKLNIQMSKFLDDYIA